MPKSHTVKDELESEQPDGPVLRLIGVSERLELVQSYLKQQYNEDSDSAVSGAALVLEDCLTVIAEVQQEIEKPLEEWLARRKSKAGVQ